MAWPMSRHVERQAKRMHEMMARCGVDSLKLVRERGGAAYAEGRRNCLNCAQARECLLWLDCVPASKEEPSFCPNRELFQSCRTN